jgi:AIPR protein
MDPTDFRDDLLNRVLTRASVDGIFTADAFSQEAADLLVSAEEVNSLDILSFQGLGKRRQSMAVNGSFHDDQDRSIALMVTHFVGSTETPSLSNTEAASLLKSLEQYLHESLNGEFLQGREPAFLEYQLAQTIMQLAARTGEDTVSRYRLYLVTDARLSARAKSIPSTAIHSIPVEYHIWDVQRFYQVHESSQGREPLELDLSDWGVDGVPALRIADGAGDVTTYLAAVPGVLLASLYRRHGSRLLEGNVRSFLTIRGKINRGIRETIMKDPTHFLAYNNGISATASAVEFDGAAIRTVTDLQIVNGGQTTASLFYATQTGRTLSLDNVFVQMKLVVVSPEDAVEMVPLISRYANSQNAVREDDFFSNSPFHVKMEELSRRLLAPAKAGISYQSKWYYERTRGQYLNERNKRSPTEQRKFETEFPRNQVLTKTDAAKYVVAWEQQPHLVSAGAQKNFKAFASLTAEEYALHPESFNENYYRRLVAQAILFNSVRAAIAKADWYEPGYLANLTAYSVAALSLAISRDSRVAKFDLLGIWERQAVSAATLDEAVHLARLALGVLTSPERFVVNVTEWAKRESAWKQLAAVPYSLRDAFILESIPKRLNASGEIAMTVNSRFDPKVSERRHIQEIEAGAWKAIRSYLAEHSRLGASEQRLLGEVIPQQARMLDLDVARGLLGLYVTAVNLGWEEAPLGDARSLR